MLSKVKEVESGGVPDEHLLLQLGLIMKSMAILAGGGALCGLVAGYLTAVRTPVCLVTVSVQPVCLATVSVQIEVR